MSDDDRSSTESPPDTDSDTDKQDHVDGSGRASPSPAADGTAQHLAPTSGDDVRELDDSTVERIAAGEVVERPASVVKELLENSLDAGATRVEVTVERGGKDLVRVRDDGRGMTEAAVRKAVQQHTTSKIRTIRDLDDGVGTLGFRGEALHTIGAVSQLTIRSRPRRAEEGASAEPPAGTELRMVGGDVESVAPTGCPAGTTVEVTDLFYNTPAREKYLGTDRTEFSRVTQVVRDYALANPNVAISLTHDGREVFSTPGRGDRKAAILAVYGRDVAESMIPVAEQPDGPLGAITGYVSHPETTRASRDYVSTFVNGRAVRSGTVRDAVVAAYGNQLANDRFPFAVIDLDVAGDAIDVNVHPRKTEVRFADESTVHERIEEAVREALLSAGMLRSGAPRGRSAPDETSVTPQRPARESPATERANTGQEPRQSATRPGKDQDSRREVSPPSPDSVGQPTDRATGDRDTPTEEEPATTASTHDTVGGDSTDGNSIDDAVHERRDVTERVFARPGGDTDLGTQQSSKFEGFEQRTLDGESAHTARSFERLPPLRVLGQYDDSYIVATAPDALLIVDQHAAHERVNFERLRDRFGGEPESQRLADPVEVELTAGETAAIDPEGSVLNHLGFDVEPTENQAVIVRAVPALLSNAADPTFLRDVLAATIDEAERPGGLIEDHTDEILADLACHPSVTANTSLSPGSVLELLTALDTCENPYACPHGRPTMVVIDADELAGRFERDYPGHGDRRP